MVSHINRVSVKMAHKIIYIYKYIGYLNVLVQFQRVYWFCLNCSVDTFLYTSVICFNLWFLIPVQESYMYLVHCRNRTSLTPIVSNSFCLYLKWRDRLVVIRLLFFLNTYTQQTRFTVTLDVYVSNHNISTILTTDLKSAYKESAYKELPVKIICFAFPNIYQGTCLL